MYKKKVDALKERKTNGMYVNSVYSTVETTHIYGLIQIFRESGSVFT